MALQSGRPRRVELTNAEGDHSYDAGPDNVRLFLFLVEAGSSEHLVCSDLDDPSDMTYMQVQGQPDGRAVVEFQLGSLEEHYAASTNDWDLVSQAFLSWIAGDEWRDTLPWANSALGFHESTDKAPRSSLPKPVPTSEDRKSPSPVDTSRPDRTCPCGLEFADAPTLIKHMATHLNIDIDPDTGIFTPSAEVRVTCHRCGATTFIPRATIQAAAQRFGAVGKLERAAVRMKRSGGLLSPGLGWLGAASAGRSLDRIEAEERSLLDALKCPGCNGDLRRDL